MKLYRTRTQFEYDWLMQKLEDEGKKSGGRWKATETNFWKEYKDLTVIWDKDDELTYGDIDYAMEHYSDEPIIEVADLMNQPTIRIHDTGVEPELVNHPVHYQGNRFEVIDIIEDYELNFTLGSAVKYILRAGKKDDKDIDLKKAIWMLERELEEEE